MSAVLRKLQFVRNLFSRRKTESEEIVEEKWVADFSKPKHARFDIKSETSFDANLRKNLFYSGYSLVLSLKKTGSLVWVEAPENRYRDLIISGSLRIDSRGGYGAGGINFRMLDSGTCYSLLVSSKGYFRLDVLRNGMPFPLIGWTELPLSTGAALSPDTSVDFSVIAYGSHILILLRGRWAAEINDSSILEGSIAFSAVSYENGDPAYKVIRQADGEAGASYASEIFLESLTVDSRSVEVAAFYEKWHDSPDVDPAVRLNLAETFAATQQHGPAMAQIQKAWETQGYRKSQKELLLAGRLARHLGLPEDAESYISQCFEADVETPEGKQALSEMAQILYTGERFKELKEYCAEAVKINPDDPVLLTFLGHAQWNLKENKKAAMSYEKAFELDKDNGIYAKNAANVYDVLGRAREALARYLDAGRAFLKTGSYNDLGLLVPKLHSLGKENWEAHSLAGKWAFAVEDWKMAGVEFKKAENLRKSKRPKPKKDGAQVFLEALLLIREGNRRDAIPLLEEAISLEKNFALFHFRLAENLFLLDDDPDNKQMWRELNASLALLDKDEKGSQAFKDNEGLAGWVNNFAAQIALRKGNVDAAAKHLARAVEVLGDLPAVRMNQALHYYLRGSIDKALEILESDKYSDSEGMMANCAGNLLVRSERYEEADKKYREALSASPDNVEYLSNLASCLIEQGFYGEADSMLAKAHAISPSPDLLVMISYVASKKGEYSRAEQACLSALEMDPHHAQSLLSLGWALMNLGRQGEIYNIILRLDKLKLNADATRGMEDLRARLDELVYKTIECHSCGLGWKVLKDPPLSPALRLFAMPPDNLPAGSCPECGKSYCIGCAKDRLDSNGRFICPSCNRSLKLVNEGLKKIVHDWAAKDGLVKDDKKGKGMLKKAGQKLKSMSSAKPPAKKRSRGRPRKKSID